MSIAKIGAKIEKTMPTIISIFPPLSLSLPLPPPKNKLRLKTSATMETKPTSTTTTVESNISRLPTCESSCAMTPSNSGLSRIKRSPLVTATTACSLSLPVAKAFGAGSSIIYTLGIGSPAVMERFSTVV